MAFCLRPITRVVRALLAGIEHSLCLVVEPFISAPSSTFKTSLELVFTVNLYTQDHIAHLQDVQHEARPLRVASRRVLLRWLGFCLALR